MTTTCTTCGLRADADPELHTDRYAHWPTVQCLTCRSNIPFGGEDRCDRCQTHYPLETMTCRRCGHSILKMYAVNKCTFCGHSQSTPEWDRTVAR